MTNTDKQEWWEENLRKFLLDHEDSENYGYLIEECEIDDLRLLLRHVAETEYKRGVEETIKVIKEQEIKESIKMINRSGVWHCRKCDYPCHLDSNYCAMCGQSLQLIPSPKES